MGLDRSLSHMDFEISYESNPHLDIQVTTKLNAMMDLLSRIITIEEILFVNQQSKREQLILALNQFEGIVLDELSYLAAKQIKNHLLEIADILASYEIKLLKDYHAIKEKYVLEMINIIKRLCMKIHEHFLETKQWKNG